jgi:hypothetical protein
MEHCLHTIENHRNLGTWRANSRCVDPHRRQKDAAEGSVGVQPEQLQEVGVKE